MMCSMKAFNGLWNLNLSKFEKLDLFPLPIVPAIRGTTRIRPAN